MSFFFDGLPVPEVEGWTPVGAARLEWGVPNSSTDFDLLLLESVLLDSGIPCQFFPHRPNEGYGVGRVIPMGVWLYVPEEHFEEAERLAKELAASQPLDWETGDDAEEA